VVVVVAPTHAEPDWQTAPTQQAAPLAPQFMHILPAPVPAQASPVLHEVAPPPQHGCPSPPQAVHMPVAVMPPSAVVWQVSPVPQLLPQQAWPLAPHASHIPLAQWVAEAVHVIVLKPPPGNPEPPPAPPLPLAPPAAVVPQQICPTAPHVVPVPSWHEPLVHVPATPVPPPVQVEPLA